MTSSTVLYEKSGNVATITLNRPDTRNALSDDVVEALLEACRQANDDQSVSCAILTGAGPAFCSGGNIKDMHERKRPPFAGSAAEMRRGYRTGIQRIPATFHALDVPIIAAVNGPAIGAGLDLAVMCDIRIASEAAQFAESFVRVGLTSGDGGAWYLPRAIGLSRAMEMSLTGDPVDAHRAAEIGLVSRVVPAERLMDEARTVAGRIARHPPQSLRLNKRLVRVSAEVDLPTALELAAALQAIVQNTEDQKEAVAAFLDKRTPNFTGA